MIERLKDVFASNNMTCPIIRDHIIVGYRAMVPEEINMIMIEKIDEIISVLNRMTE